MSPSDFGRRAFLQSGLVASSALLLAACAQRSETAAANTQPSRGGTLNVGLPSDPKGVDAAVVNSVWGFVARALSDSLVFYNPETKDFQPWLAQDWQINDTATEYTFQLRDDVTFNDGTPLTAQVVQANFDSLNRTGIHPSARSIVNTISNVEILDNHELRVHFDEPNASFLVGLSRPHAAIVSQATAESPVSDRQYFLDGSGPFTLERYTDNDSIILVRREGYDWAPDYFSHTGEAYLDRVVYKVIPEDSVRLGALQSGEIDFIFNYSAQYVEQLEASGIIISDSSRSPATGYEFPLNVQTPALQDVRVRRALQHGVDREALSQIVTNGRAAPATGPLTKDNPYYVNVSDLLAYDPDQANALLDEAGWNEQNDEGIRVKDGTTLTLRTSSYVKSGEVVQSHWRKIGVDLVIDPPLASEAEAANLAGKYDVPFTFHSSPDPDVLRTNYSISSGNRSNLPAPNELDALLIKQNTIIDHDERQKVVNEIARVIIGDAYKIPLLDDVHLWAFRSSVHDLKHTGLDQLLYDAWVDAA